MMNENPKYVSKKGGRIDCFKGDTGLLFRVCSEQLSLYCNDIVAAKAQLIRLERLKSESGNMAIKLLNRTNNNFRRLVETAAKPYISKN